LFCFEIFPMDFPSMIINTVAMVKYITIEMIIL